jgi:ankyrin repeat protein
MQAVVSENIAVLKVLLDAKADVKGTMAAPEEIDALSLAVGKSRADMVKLLLAAGADPMVRIDGEVSLLEFAILSEQPEVAALLRKAGVPEPSKARIAELKKAASEP